MPPASQSNNDPFGPAGWGRRIIALCIDWLVALLSVSAFTGVTILSPEQQNPWLPLVAFWCEVSLLTGLLGYSIGKRLCDIKVVGPNGRPVGLARAALRTLLICLVVPPLVTNSERRGLHDLAVGSIVTRR